MYRVEFFTNKQFTHKENALKTRNCTASQPYLFIILWVFLFGV